MVAGLGLVSRSIRGGFSCSASSFFSGARRLERKEIYW